MSSVISGVGWFFAIISPLIGIYALSTGNWIGVLSAFFSFCTGCAFIILRCLVVQLEEQAGAIDTNRSELHQLKREVEKLKRNRDS